MMKIKGTLLDLGFNRGFDGRPPSALGLYIITVILAVVVIAMKEWMGLIVVAILWMSAWYISVPGTDERR